MPKTRIFATFGDYCDERPGSQSLGGHIDDEVQIGGWYRDDIDAEPIVATHLDSWRVAVFRKTGDVIATNPYHKIVRLLGTVRPNMPQREIVEHFDAVGNPRESLSLSQVAELCSPLEDKSDDWELPAGQAMSADDLEPECDACE